MFRFITDAWQYASTAEDGRESEHWPKAWKEGNDIADAMAARGALGRVSPHCARWLEMLPDNTDPTPRARRNLEQGILPSISRFAGDWARKNHERYSHAEEALRDRLIGSFWAAALASPTSALVTVMPSDGADRKRKLDELSQQVKELQEHRGETDHTKLELQAERETAYRHLRVESSAALADLFQRMEAGTLPRSQLRSSAATALVEEVSATLARAQDETELQRLAGDLSKSKRGVPTRQARIASGEAFAPLADLGLLEWVQPAGRGWNLRLQNGEPSRLLFEGVRKELNWVLFVLGKTGDGNTPSCVQIFPDRGPATRRHEKGRKGGGKSKGTKGGKGKGKTDTGGGRGDGGGGEPAMAARP
ncbi:unnamed protein product [Symbiodinium sp. CCMP2592]|nr:unnamed protein product [Symbiodinium sp. CCMP2592]